MTLIKDIWKNKWFKFIFFSIIYILWFVVWMRAWWMIFGVLIIYDIYISKYLYRWIGSKHEAKKKKSKSYRSAMGWVEAIVFAVIVASVFRLFFFEMYVIPSPSMEKTLLVGDYLLVSKSSYGPKMPNTPLNFPLVHNTLPLSSTKPSFSTLISRPYKRLKGFGQVQRNDVVVFNFPEGDTVAMIAPMDSYYRLVRAYGREYVLANSEITVRPVDKKDNYIKRCVAISGDSLQVINSMVYVNGQLQPEIPGKQYRYIVRTNGTAINPQIFDDLDIVTNRDVYRDGAEYLMILTDEAVKKLESLGNVLSVSRDNSFPDQANVDIFPHRPDLYRWSENNFGPIWVPKKGASVALTLENLPLYERIIRVYENNALAVQDSTILINGEPCASYTFQMDYYFMMGDNRNNSLDSRYWGFVPEDHVVGKAKFVWMSVDENKKFPSNIRFSRIFRNIK